MLHFHSARRTVWRRSLEPGERDICGLVDGHCLLKCWWMALSAFVLDFCVADWNRHGCLGAPVLCVVSWNRNFAQQHMWSTKCSKIWVQFSSRNDFPRTGVNTEKRNWLLWNEGELLSFGLSGCLEMYSWKCARRRTRTWACQHWHPAFLVCLTKPASTFNEESFCFNWCRCTVCRKQCFAIWEYWSRAKPGCAGEAQCTRGATRKWKPEIRLE